MQNFSLLTIFSICLFYSVPNLCQHFFRDNLLTTTHLWFVFQFCALSDQLYRSPSHHKVVREQVCKHLKKNPEDFREFVPEDFDTYCYHMSRKGTWGDHVTLKAAADCFGVNIWLLTSYPDAAVLEIQGKAKKTDRILYLSFWAEVIPFQLSIEA